MGAARVLHANLFEPGGATRAPGGTVVADSSMQWALETLGGVPLSSEAKAPDDRPTSPTVTLEAVLQLYQRKQAKALVEVKEERKRLLEAVRRRDRKDRARSVIGALPATKDLPGLTVTKPHGTCPGCRRKVMLRRRHSYDVNVSRDIHWLAGSHRRDPTIPGRCPGAGKPPVPEGAL